MPMLGVSEVVGALEKITVAVDVSSRMTAAEGSSLVVRKAKANFSGSHRPGQPHVGGDQPNVVTGNLRRSIRATPLIRLGFGDYATRVGPTAIYGRRVELGYLNQRGYPYFVPAATAAAVEFRAMGARNYAKALRV
jgi:hypothetical protein